MICALFKSIKLFIGQLVHMLLIWSKELLDLDLEIISSKEIFVSKIKNHWITYKALTSQYVH